MKKVEDKELYKYIPKASEFLIYSAAIVFVAGSLLLFFLAAVYHYTPQGDALLWWLLIPLSLIVVALFMHRGIARTGGIIYGALLLCIIIPTIIALCR